MAVTSAGKDVDLMGRGKGQQWMANREGREPGQTPLTRLWSIGKQKTKLTVMLTLVQCSDSQGDDKPG